MDVQTPFPSSQQDLIPDNGDHFSKRKILLIVGSLLLVFSTVGFLLTKHSENKLSETTFIESPTVTPYITNKIIIPPSPSPSISIVPVMVINIDPIYKSQGNKRLHEIVRDLEGGSSGPLKDNDPETMITKYIKDIQEVSGGYAHYQVKEFHTMDVFPHQCDQVNYSYCSSTDERFQFTESQFLKCIQAQTPEDKKTYCHDPNVLDYLKLLKDYQVCEKRNTGEISELWIMSRFWIGVWEANMTGPGSFFTNWNPIEGSTCKKQMHIMGFSYQRTNAEMLHNMGHRIEGTMNHVYGEWTNLEHPIKPLSQLTPWEQFAMRTNDASWVSACGNVHGFINSTIGYDYTNPTVVKSTCNDWLNYPNLTGKVQDISCDAWRCTEYGFYKFWLTHIPKSDGTTNGKWNNWWKYIIEK